MIDMEQEVEVIWGAKCKRHYLELGYEDRKIGELFYPKLKDVSLGCHSFVEITCDYCGDKYKTRYYTYNKGKKSINNKDCCFKCKQLKAQEYHNSTYKSRAKKAFDKLNKIMKEHDYTLLTKQEDYSGIYMNIEYICPKHGKVNSELNRLINENKLCNQCGNEVISKTKRLSSEDVKTRIDSVNNNTLLNPLDYIGDNARNLRIKCKCGREYLTSLTAFHNGKNQCGNCCGSESRGEQKVRQWLEDNNIEYIPEYTFKECRDKNPLPFDFYLPKNNICIEYDGQQHFQPWKTRGNIDAYNKIVSHDKIKNEYCEKNNIKLIRIPYNKYRHVNEILNKELLIM